MNKYLKPLIILGAMLGASAAAPINASVIYKLDDGVGEVSIGVGGITDMVWLNAFTTQPGGESITQVSAAFGRDSGNPSGLMGGEAVTFVVWDDPNNDGDPSDAIVLTTQAHNIVNFDDGVTFDVVSLLTPVTVSGGFFVGVQAPPLVGALFPAAQDISTLINGTSWVAASPGGTNLNNLSGADLFGTIEGFGLPGAWMVRAEGNSVPEPTTLLLMGLGLAGLGFARRRR